MKVNHRFAQGLKRTGSSTLWSSGTLSSIIFYFSSKDEICSNTKLQLVQFLLRIVHKLNVINPRKKGLPRSVYINDLLNSIIALFLCQFF